MTRIVTTEVLTIRRTAVSFSDHDLILFYVLDGRLALKVNEAVETIEKGQMGFINTNTVYQATAESCVVQQIKIHTVEAATYYPDMKNLIFWSDSLRHEDTTDSFNVGREKIFLSDCLNLYFEEDTQEGLSKQSEYILSLLCLEYTVFDDNQGKHNYISEDKKNRLLACLEFIEQHLQSKLTLQHLANEIKITPQHLTSLWKEYFGYSFMEYVKRKRLYQAEKYLFFSDLTITQIIMECGFSDKKYFYQSFHEIYNMSPLQWRKKWQQSKHVADTLTFQEASTLIQQFRKEKGLYVKPMDSKMHQKYQELKEMERKHILFPKMAVSLNLVDTLQMDDTQIEPLTMFGYDLFMRLVHQHDLELRIIVPIRQMVHEVIIVTNELSPISLDEVIIQSLIRFGRFSFSRWQVDLVCESSKELMEASKIKRELKDQGINAVTILF